MSRLSVIIVLSSLLCGMRLGALPENREQELTVAASFTGQEFIHPDTPVEIRLNRALEPAEGRLALMIGAFDLTGLCAAIDQGLRYSAALPLPVGETEVAVYLVAPSGEWREIARFPLRVVAKDAAPTEQPPAVNSEVAPSQTPDANQPQPDQKPRKFGFDKFDWIPQINIGFKSQFAEIHFPDSNRPQRPTFTDGVLSGSLRNELARGQFNAQGQFDVVGSSFRNEALRFGLLGQDAPLVDLSNYQMQFQIGSRKFFVGHTNHGAHRHLINNFNSRGLTFAIPVVKGIDLTLAAMNSTSIVGWSNFFGVDKARHQLHSGTLGFELLPQRPGGLRFEVGMLDAWLQPRSNFNQGNVNDTERSQGGTARLLFSDKSQRLRFDGGFTRNRFTNPDDPLLAQGANVVQVNSNTRNARYADVSFNLLRNFAFSKPPAPSGDQAQTVDQSQAAPARKLNLVLNLRHERVDPLFRSIGAQTQADRHNNQVEAVGSFGEVNFNVARASFNDNLVGIPTILRTNTRIVSFAVNAPLSQLLVKAQSPPSPIQPWLPRLGYTFNQVRARGAFAPLGFNDASAIPDQANIVQTVTAEWQFEKWRVTYQLNHSLQDNRQTGRERADLQNFIHNVAFGWNPRPTLSLNFEVNFEDASNREQVSDNHTLRYGLNTNWQMTPRQNWNAVFSTIGAGGFLQGARMNDNRNIEFDLQWSYRLTRESPNRFKKAQVNYFIRYANRYARLRDFLGGFNTLTRLNTFNTGLNFIFF